MAVGRTFALTCLLVEDPPSGARGVRADAPTEWSQDLGWYAGQRAAIAVALVGIGVRRVIWIEDPVQQCIIASIIGPYTDSSE